MKKSMNGVITVWKSYGRSGKKILPTYCSKEKDYLIEDVDFTDEEVENLRRIAENEG